MNQTMIPEVPAPPAELGLIQLAQPRMNKQDDIVDYLMQLERGEYDTIYAQVSETVTLDAEAWIELTHGLLENRDWLDGKGGCNSWSEIKQINDRNEYLQLTPAQLATYRATAYSLVIEVVSPSGGRIYIDPQGYRYARYVSFPMTPDTPPSKSREQIRREEQAEQDRLEALKPPPPPVREWSREEAIREIRSGLKTRSGRNWSVKGGRGTSYCWIEIGLTPKDEQLPEEEREILIAALRDLLGTRSFNVPASNAYRQEYVDRAHGRTPSVIGEP